MNNKLGDFIESLILANKITGEEDLSYFISIDHNKNLYSLDGFYIEKGTELYNIKIDIKNKELLFTFDSKGSNLKKTESFKQFLNKKYQGTLSIDTIQQKDFKLRSSLRIKGSLKSIQNFIADHTLIINEFI